LEGMSARIAPFAKPAVTMRVTDAPTGRLVTTRSDRYVTLVESERRKGVIGRAVGTVSAVHNPKYDSILNSGRLVMSLRHLFLLCSVRQ